MNSRVGFGLALSLFAAGCATAPPPTISERIARPDVGALVSREVGEPMVEVEDSRRVDGVRLLMGRTARMAMGARYEFDVDRLVSDYASNPPYFCGSGRAFDILGFPLGQGRYCVTEADLRRGGATFERGMIPTEDASNFRQQLLYQGRAGTTVRLSYREFSGDLARPAFTQDLTFDIADDPVIGVKGARIEVVEATNAGITYRLVRPFDGAGQ